MAENRSTTIEKQTDLGAGCFLLQLSGPEIAREARAGQFVMLGLPDLGEMLIRRPFSVARKVAGPDGEPSSFEVLYKVVGKNTLAFSRLRPGAQMTALGPLGRGFWLPAGDEELEVLLVAGGIGNAAFPLLLQEAEQRRQQCTLFFGGRSRGDLTLLDWFSEHCAEVVPVTEDGSLGAKGFVTGPLEARLDQPSDKPRIVLSCGPHPMLKAVAELCRERDLPCQVALEETMACGFGVCLGCVVPVAEPATDFDTYVRVCTEGPVFDAREIIL